MFRYEHSQPTLDAKLYRAAKNGILARVQQLVQRGANMNATHYDDEYTALHVACYKGHLDVVRYLIEDGLVNAETANKKGNTALHHACCESGCVDVVRYLIQHAEANTEATNKNGETPLHFASESDDVKAVRYLIEHGMKSNVDATDNYGCTPLHGASRRGCLDIFGHSNQRG